jgi:hypothetical protein
MPSFFSWLDYSESERKKMLDLVSRFRDRDTRDELGVGSIRDAFADMFFPGTSTIQSRARYFLFIPWTYLRLERKRGLSEKAGAVARKEEIRLIFGLLKSKEKEGVIGRDAKEKLQRLPSNIYWQGLGAWGIRLFRGTQYQYHHYLDVYHAGPQQALYNDDGEPIESQRRSGWHSGLPPAPKDFPDSCNFSLDSSEAAYLQERIIMNQPHTLLGFLAERGRSCDPVDYPWEHSQYASFPEQIRSCLGHARNFSESIFGSPLLYNLMLAEEVGNKELIDEYREKIQAWAAELISKRSDILALWFKRIHEFWEIVQTTSVRIPFMTKQFVERWLSLVFGNGSASRIADNPKARQLILERERQLKRSLSRLDNPRARELWSGHAGDFRLDYRWWIAQTHINDILEGLGSKSHVESK